MPTENRVRIHRNKLVLDCFFNAAGRLCKKIESHDAGSVTHDYVFDAAGHLTEARRDGFVEEQYAYNSAGQRVEQQRARCRYTDRVSGLLRYDDKGRLTRAGDTSYSYDGRGALAERCDATGIVRFSYGDDTRLDQAIFSNGDTVRYEYAEGELGPVRRFRRGNLTAEYAWRGLLLTLWRDYEHELEYRFSYTETGILDSVHIMPLSPSLVAARALSPNSDPWHELAAKQRRESLRELIGSGLTLACGCDQVGTPKLLTHGDRIIKQLTWDSFGNLRDDTLPELSLPIGFAGGLIDRDTGLVRFGYRDYDPAVGRFTAPDPLGDTGGDHDLYDYCVDDPVTMNDPAGLFPPLLLFLGGKALALGLGAAGSYLAGKMADKSSRWFGGKETTAATDGVLEVLPKVAAMSGISAVGGALPWALENAALAAPGLISQGVTAASSGVAHTAATASKVVSRGVATASSGVERAADLMIKADIAKNALLKSPTLAGTVARAVKNTTEFLSGRYMPYAPMGVTPTKWETRGVGSNIVEEYGPPILEKAGQLILKLHNSPEKWEPYVGQGMR